MADTSPEYHQNYPSTVNAAIAALNNRNSNNNINNGNMPEIQEPQRYVNPQDIFNSYGYSSPALGDTNFGNKDNGESLFDNESNGTVSGGSTKDSEEITQEEFEESMLSLFEEEPTAQVTHTVEEEEEEEEVELDNMSPSVSSASYQDSATTTALISQGDVNGVYMPELNGNQRGYAQQQQQQQQQTSSTTTPSRKLCLPTAVSSYPPTSTSISNPNSAAISPVVPPARQRRFNQDSIPSVRILKRAKVLMKQYPAQQTKKLVGSFLTLHRDIEHNMMKMWDLVESSITQPFGVAVPQIQDDNSAELQHHHQQQMEQYSMGNQTTLLNLGSSAPPTSAPTSPHQAINNHGTSSVSTPTPTPPPTMTSSSSNKRSREPSSSTSSNNNNNSRKNSTGSKKRTKSPARVPSSTPSLVPPPRRSWDPSVWQIREANNTAMRFLGGGTKAMDIAKHMVMTAGGQMNNPLGGQQQQYSTAATTEDENNRPAKKARTKQKKD